MVIVSLMVLTMGLNCFPGYEHNEIPFIVQSPDEVRRSSTTETSDLDPEKASRIGEISRFTLQLLGGDLDFWMSPEVDAELDRLMEFKDLTELGRDHLETAKLLKSVLEQDTDPMELAYWNWGLLHRSHGNVSMELISHVARARIEQLGHAENELMPSLRSELASEFINVLAILDCQAIHAGPSRVNAGVRMSSIALSNGRMISERFPDEFSQALERFACCIPEATIRSRPYSGMLLAHAMGRESSAMLTEQEARRYFRLLPIDAISQHRILERAFGTDHASAHEFVTSEWKPAVVSLCEEADRPELIPHFLNLIDGNLLFYRATMLPEENHLRDLRYLAYYRQALDAIEFYLDDYPGPPWQHDRRLLTSPNAIDARLFSSLCATPLKRLDYFNATRDGDLEVASQLAELNAAADKVVNRMHEGNYDTARFFIGSSLIRQRQVTERE